MALNARWAESWRTFRFRASLDEAMLSRAETTKTILERVVRAVDLVPFVAVVAVVD